jgi:hypothetical protein
MHLKRPAVFFILLALVLAGLATRTSTRDRLDSPYFKGASAMVYAHALAASEGTPLDTISVKANHPDGYVPARYRADGFETAWAKAYRAARFVSEVDGRDFARRTTMFLAALCAFTMYGLTRRVWDCQASGLVAAFFVAFFAPVVIATNGRTFTHTTLAPFFVTAHAALVVATLGASTRRRAIVRAAGAALVAFVLAVSWEPGSAVLAIWSVGLALSTRDDDARRERVLLLGGQALALVLACLSSHYLVATRALGSWATTLVVASAVVSMLPPRARLPRYPRLAMPAILLAAASVWWLVMTPVRAGATEQFPAWSYLVARALHVFGRPESPAALSDWMRHVWSLDHAPLQPQTAIEVFLPLTLLAIAFALNAEVRARRVFVSAVIVAVGAAVATLADRSALPVSVLAMVVVVSGAARSVSKSIRKRGPLLVAAALVALAAVVFRGGTVDASYQIARATGAANRDPYSFLWVSFENTDRELVRFVATRTSVHDAFLAPDDLSALLRAFTGRSVVALPGAMSKKPAARHVAMTRAIYGTEEELYETCRTTHIDYVVYSIDVLLDTGRYSPRYLAGVAAVDPASIAYKMHFEPESLQRFTLLYENDHYRLFSVSGTPQPIFATDHPPFYQTDLLTKANRDVDAFRQLAVQVMLTYAEGARARAHGNPEGARRRLEWCLLQAPHYTQARIALADALMDLDRYNDARGVIAKLIAYAPDNTKALYYAAFIAAQLGKTDEAKSYLTLLLSIERDPQLIERAKALQSAVEQGVPLRKGAPSNG